MPTRYALVVGTKGYKYSIDSNCDFDDHFKSKYYNNSDVSKISCVAIGPNNRWAVLASTGKSTYRGCNGFNEKMNEIQCSDIKHISFGCGDSWAITMKSGWCHAQLYEDALKAVNEVNGKISYVSLGARRSDWIVGYGHNGTKKGAGISVALSSLLTGINASKKEIKRVEIGSNGHYFVHHEEGFRWSLPTDLSRWFKDTPHSFTSVSLW